MSTSDAPLAGPGTQVHIVAIGGVMMSAIARLLAAQGCRVTGSDLNASEYTEALEAEGIPVAVGPHSASNLPPGAQWLAISAAVPADNPEVAAARERGLPVLSRAEVLGHVVNARRGVAVAGTHGKTTTSGLIAVLLTEAGLEPTFLVGSTVRNYGTNGRVGAGDWVVVEADEYARAFLTLEPQIALVTNLEHDHPDIYADFVDLEATFRQFVAQVRPDGLLLLGADCPAARALAQSAPCRVETYGFESDADWLVMSWAAEGLGTRFELRSPAGETVSVVSQLAGRHNVQNAAGAIAAAVGAGVPLAEAAALLARCAGTSRRLELLADAGGIRVLDDYAHHPTEVAATIAAARALGGRLRVVFEPHQYARTRALIRDYVGVFDEADEALITDIHIARESDLSGVSSALLAEVAGAARYVGSADDAEAWLTGSAGANETWLVMGAGNITRLAHRLADWVRARADDRSARP